MFIPAHLAAGLIVGKLTGEYSASLVGAFIPDMDHLYLFYKSKILFNPKSMFLVLRNKFPLEGDARMIPHNIIFWFLVSFVSVIFDFKTGIAFSISYLFHIILDALNDEDFYPFFPNKKIKVKGLIEYYSKYEFIFTIFLFTLFIFI